MRRSEAKRYRRHINAILITLADETAVEMTDLFEPWIIGKNYKVGDRVKHNDELYKCIQEHDSQESWTPNLTPALWMVISIEEYPQWIQPKGSEDAYSVGDKVSHNDKHWISEVDANVWEPGVYGWGEVNA